MTKFLQTLLDGVSVGSLYALIALGYTMVYGVLKFINFAHGDIFMVGAWVAFVAASVAGWTSIDSAPPWYAAFVLLVVGMALCASLGVLAERFAYRPLRRSPRLNVLITAIGVSLLIQNVGQLNFIFGADPKKMPPLLPDKILFSVASVNVEFIDAMMIGTALLLMIGLQWLVYGTKLGLGMRAVSHDPTTAALMGVPVDRVISMTFAIGSALAAAAGLLFALEYRNLNQPAASTWVLLGLKAFVAAVVGGIGNLHGAMLGGIIIGLIEWFGAAYLSAQFRDVYVFALLILCLLVKPSGLLGKPVAEKV